MSFKEHVLPKDIIERLVRPQTISDLHEKMTRAVELGRGVRLNGPEMDLLAVNGVLRTVCLAAVAEIEALAAERIAARCEASSAKE